MFYFYVCNCKKFKKSKDKTPWATFGMREIEFHTGYEMPRNTGNQIFPFQRLDMFGKVY